MDLDDLLEDLLEGVTDAARTRARRVARQASRRTRGVRRQARRLARAVGVLVATVFGALTLALGLVGSPGGLRLFGAALTLLVAAAAGGVALVAHRAERRDPRSRASRARRRRTRRRRAGSIEPPDLDEVDLPADVEEDWERLLLARRLVQDLSQDGWIEGAAVMEVDGLVVRLHRLLVVDGRTARLGGRSSPELRRQVGDLADLLVALADEAVHLQVADTGARTSVPATLADARDNLQALRAARREVERIDQPRPQPGV